MCGIAGEYRFDRTARIDESVIPRLAATLHHRGPDEWGYHLGPHASTLLLSTRLSIVDLANGRQPIANEDGSVWVILNGEIYGFAELARSLEQRGHRFRTRTDTEVIVHLYEEVGESFVDHLRGEFAIALLDQRQDALYLVRDRFGIKPLFHAERPEGIVFGSEIKALFQFPGMRRELNRRHLVHTLHGLLAPGETYFEGVRDVEPGCMLRVSRDGVTRRRYWDLPFLADPAQAPARVDEREAIDEYRRLLHEAVRLRLHGDVEAGVFLSGGIDSTAIATLMADEATRPVKAFTIAFANETFDESAHAVGLASTLGFDHHLVRIGRGELGPAFERSIWHHEIAVGNSHGVAKFLLSRLARQHHLKVVLTGEGADESLAGYNVFRHLLLLDALRRQPRDPQLRRDLDALLNSLGMYSGILPVRELPDYARITSLFGAYPYAMARAIRLSRAARRILSREFRAEIADLDPIARTAHSIGIGRLSGLDPVSAHQYYGFKADLASYILVCLGDRAEMAHSLEGRLPFLDHKVVEFACTLPVDLKVRDGATKHVLRAAMASRIPDAAARRKRPFMAPSAETLGLDRRDRRNDTDPGRFLDRDVVRKVGLFDPFAIAAMRQSLRLLPARSYAHSLAETLLTIVASTHALHELFCERFDDSVARFCAPVQALPAPASV
jgi:asparagine synthase (glutamine-hydrolysing)